MSDKEKKLNINLSDKSGNPVGSIHDIPIEDILAWKPGNPYAEGDIVTDGDGVKFECVDADEADTDD